MADFDLPSFSLGLDFDLDSQPQPIPPEDPPSPEPARPPSPPNPSFSLINDDDSEIPAVVPDSPEAEAPRSFKRLRRGMGSASGSAVLRRCSMEAAVKADDDIEEFSSQEDRVRENEQSSSQYHSGCSSSVFSLPRRGVLNTQSESQWRSTKRKQPSLSSVSANLETSDKSVFPKLTISPLRRFQLIDSDSDSDDSSSDSAPENITDDMLNTSSKGKLRNSDQFPTTKNTSQVEDLWKDFAAQKSSSIATPALDEVCEEYFGRVKEKNEAPNLRHEKYTVDYKSPYQKSSVINIDQPLEKLDDPVPPAHRYFFHDDPRIQNLVRNRLPYFFPLGAQNNRETQHTPPSVIDYMSQFSHGEGSKQVTGRSNVKANTARGKKKMVEETSQGPGGWMNPKTSMEIPKDAGKRRVQADGQSSGHWYMGSGGKRVYVTKTGQELTGRIAYMQYRKDNRAGGSKRSKKKTTKTSTAKKKGVAKKK